MYSIKTNDMLYTHRSINTKYSTTNYTKISSFLRLFYTFKRKNVKECPSFLVNNPQLNLQLSKPMAGLKKKSCRA